MRPSHKLHLFFLKVNKGMANTYIAIAASLGDTFSNALENDLLFYASEPARLMLGTQSNVLAQLQIGSNNVVFNEFVTFSSNVKIDGSMSVTSNMSTKGSILFNSNLMVLGPVTLCNNVQILGTLNAENGLLINGGASYCNGDVYCINFNSNGLIDQRVFLRSHFGNPTIYLNQVQDPSNQPVQLFQTSNSEGFITNNHNLNIFSHSNINLGNSNSIYVTLSNTGYLGIGNSNPKAKLDVFNGNVNADNVIRQKKSTNTSNLLGININWQNIVNGNEHCIYFETTQQLNTQTLQGTRIQRHRLLLSNPFTLTSYVATGYGDVQPYTSLFVYSSNLSTSNIKIQSYISNFSSGGDIKHELDVNVFIASTDIGHVWLS